jgi:hypothetical protein
LAVYLPSWVIQDGNYGDFSRGDRAAFALEFHAPRPLTAFKSEGSDAPSLSHAGGEAFRYAASGLVVHRAETWWAIDFGLMAFREEAPPQGIRRGDWVRGEIELSVDPFFYFENLAHEADAPALIHGWTVEKIEKNTTPIIEVEGRCLARDPARPSWTEIARTDAWGDGAMAEYILYCKRHDRPARRTRGR